MPGTNHLALLVPSIYYLGCSVLKLHNSRDTWIYWRLWAAREVLDVNILTRPGSVYGGAEIPDTPGYARTATGTPLYIRDSGVIGLVRVDQISSQVMDWRSVASTWAKYE